MSDKSGPVRTYQCPGCWSVNAMPYLRCGYECECGEALTLIDLRGEPRPALTGERNR